MKISEKGLELIKYYESLHDGDLTLIGLQPKMCPASIWTEGYGEVILYNGKPLKGEENKELAYKLSTIKTKEDAENKLKNTIVKFEKQIDSLNLQLKQNEFDALVSFIYNLGFGSLQKSTLLKRIKEKQGDIEEAFLMWNKCGGKELKGLTKRRLSESKLFLDNILEI